MVKHLILVVVAAVASIGSLNSAQVDSAWPQWGGPRRDFVVRTPPLAASWPVSGPPRLWTRPLGEGHSAFVFEGGRLYTMYRPAGQEARTARAQERLIALDASTGRTIWEHAYEEQTTGLNLSEGAGPHSTPLIVGDRLYAVSSRMRLLALNKATGAMLWSRDLIQEYGATPDERGYSSSPIAYERTVIVPAGAPNGSVLAFDQQTGALMWKGGSFPVAPASPILITFGGEGQLIVTGAGAIVGMNPTTGHVLWSHKINWGLNISTPVWIPEDLLFVSAAYNNASRLLKLTTIDGTTSVTEQWFQNRMRVHSAPSYGLEICSSVPAAISGRDPPLRPI
jgi:outer membrane protein assembly factor BamB